MGRNNPQQIDPLVKDLGRAAQNLATRKQHLKRSASSAFEKITGSRQQPRRIRRRQLIERRGKRRPRVSSDATRSRRER